MAYHSSSSGMDGWRVRELRKLPEPILDMLACFFNMVKSTGCWPLSLQRALVSLIPKGQGCQPLDLRPISVMSVIYRLWAVRRLSDLLAWQEGWASKVQHGFRPGHCPADVFWVLALRVERALLEGKPFYTA